MKRYTREDQLARAAGARTIVFILLGLLAAVLFRAQVLGSSQWLLQSETNRLRSSTIPAPRGIIRDREGRALADNVPGYSLSIDARPPEEMMDALIKLGEHLEISEKQFQTIERRIRARPTRPLLVSVDVPFDAVAAIEERRSAFPLIIIESRPKRRYPNGEVTAHVLGYVGEINETELNSPEFEGAPRGTIVGRSGVESVYEPVLQGKAGTRYVEVDALGRIVASFRGTSPVAEEPGADVDLSLDLDLMKWIHHIFPKGLSGAVVVLDVETAGVLALYSAPSFDPNVLVGVVAAQDWAHLSQNPSSPLLNRAVMGKYPPGSPWKLASAAIALEAGVVTPTERMPVSCRGSFRFGNRVVRCWKESGHGSLDLAGAIQHSCNVYFYQLGLRTGLRRLLEGGNRMGFGEQSGIDLPQEATGTFPHGVAFWQERFGYRATEGEVLNLVLGQGPNAQTPLKMAQFMLAIARDGSAPAPWLFERGRGSDEWRLDVSEESLEQVREGIRRVTAPGGTAFLSSLEHFDLLGKTGTAQSGGDRPNHAWFTSMAGQRGGLPEVVVVVLIEFGDTGSGMAAPIAAKTADFYLRSKHGIPQDSIQTLREYLRAGRNTAWAYAGQGGG